MYTAAIRKYKITFSQKIMKIKYIYRLYYSYSFVITQLLICGFSY